ncbi:Hypothetical protein FKW44_008488, partial [Caligus rogercresseyi]
RRLDAVLELFQTGHDAQDVIKLLHYPKPTVYDIIKRFKVTVEYSRKVTAPECHDQVSQVPGWV